MATCWRRKVLTLTAALLATAVLVCAENMRDELESGYFDREYSLTKPYAGGWPAPLVRRLVRVRGADLSSFSVVLQVRTGT